MIYLILFLKNKLNKIIQNEKILEPIKIYNKYQIIYKNIYAITKMSVVDNRFNYVFDLFHQKFHETKIKTYILET